MSKYSAIIKVPGYDVQALIQTGDKKRLTPEEQHAIIKVFDILFVNGFYQAPLHIMQHHIRELGESTLADRMTDISYMY